MKSDDFVELYELLRGGPSANQVLDAEAAFMQQDYSAALKTMRFAREGFHSRRLRLLRDDADSSPPLQTKREKAQQILQRFDVLIAALAEAEEKHPRPIQHPDLPAHFASQYAATATADDRLDYVYLAFDVRPVKEAGDLIPGALYFIASEEKTFCVQVDDPLPESSTAEERTEANAATEVPMRAVETGKRMPAMSRQQFLELGRRGWLVRLRKKTTKPAKHSPATSPPQPPPESSPAELEAETELDVNERDKILDVGAFTQLLDSAHRSRMLPESDQIAQVRDREFRRGHFQKALLTMEGLHGKFSAAAASQQAQVRREDADIASGRIKMSPKDLQAKRMRDQAASQAIERARSRFSRVLDGLRILARTMNID